MPFIWTKIFFNGNAFLLYLIPQTRQNYVTLNIGCLLIFIGVYIEKGVGLVIPGLFVYTMLLRVAIPILNGDFHVGEDGVTPVIADQMFFVRPHGRVSGNLDTAGSA